MLKQVSRASSVSVDGLEGVRHRGSHRRPCLGGRRPAARCECRLTPCLSLCRVPSPCHPRAPMALALASGSWQDQLRTLCHGHTSHTHAHAHTQPSTHAHAHVSTPLHMRMLPHHLTAGDRILVAPPCPALHPRERPHKSSRRSSVSLFSHPERSRTWERQGSRNLETAVDTIGDRASENPRGRKRTRHGSRGGLRNR